MSYCSKLKKREETVIAPWVLRRIAMHIKVVGVSVARQIRVANIPRYSLRSLELSSRVDYGQPWG